MRIAKFMAAAGVASRRKSEELILKGKVRLNGNTVTHPGTQVDELKDTVTVDGNRIKISEDRVYIMLNKPVGCVSTCFDDKGRRTVLDFLSGVDCRVYPVGRLDFTTEGLLLLTNDGELANRLTHPKHEVSKRYFAVVRGDVSAEDIQKLTSGVSLDGYKTAPARVKITKASTDKTELTITITEGKNRQVRRMFETLEKEVLFLKRISVGDINLGNLKRGEFRFLSREEIDYLKRA